MSTRTGQPQPWPMFHKMFADAASTHNAAFGAASFVLVALGNMILMSALYLLLSVTDSTVGCRLIPTGHDRDGGCAAVGGSFTVIYCGVQVSAKFGYGWVQSM